MTNNTPNDESNSESLARAVSNSKKIGIEKLIPYSDGRFVYYPAGKFRKGYILSGKQAAALFDSIERKGINFSHIVLMGAAVSFVFSKFISDTIRETTWFWLALFGIAGLVLLIEPIIIKNRLLKKFPGIRPCQHPYPHNYSRLRTLTKPMCSLWASISFGAFMLLIATSLPLLLMNDVEVNMPAWAVYPASVLTLAISGVFFQMVFFHIKLRQINKRKPMIQDLVPVNPNTGQMTPNPFEVS